jgi:hypothetical protein
LFFAGARSASVLPEMPQSRWTIWRARLRTPHETQAQFGVSECGTPGWLGCSAYAAVSVAVVDQRRSLRAIFPKGFAWADSKGSVKTETRLRIHIPAALNLDV